MTFVCLTKSVAQIVLLQDPDYVLIITMNCIKPNHIINMAYYNIFLTWHGLIKNIQQQFCFLSAQTMFILAVPVLLVVCFIHFFFTPNLCQNMLEFDLMTLMSMMLNKSVFSSL